MKLSDLLDTLDKESKKLLSAFFQEKKIRSSMPHDHRVAEMLELDARMGGALTQTLTEHLLTLKAYLQGRPVKLEHLTFILRNIASSYEVKLTSTDLKLISYYASHPEATPSEAAANLKVAPSWERRRRGELVRKNVISFPAVVNPARLGLRKVVVLVDEPQTSGKEVNVSLAKWLTAEHLLWGGPPFLLQVYTVPAGWAWLPIRELNPVRAWLVRSTAYGLNTASYEPGLGWKLNVEAWGVYFKELLAEGWEVPSESSWRRVEHEGTPLPLEAWEVKAAALLAADTRMRLEALAEAIGKSLAAAHQCKQKLLADALTPILNLNHVGLSESLLLILEELDVSFQAVEAALRELPKIWVYKVEDFRGSEELLCWLELPSGLTHKLTRVLEEVLAPVAKYSLYFRGYHLGSSLPSPSLYNGKKKSWQPPQPAAEKLKPSRLEKKRSL